MTVLLFERYRCVSFLNQRCETVWQRSLLSFLRNRKQAWSLLSEFIGEPQTAAILISWLFYFPHFHHDFPFFFHPFHHNRNYFNEYLESNKVINKGAGQATRLKTTNSRRGLFIFWTEGESKEAANHILSFFRRDTNGFSKTRQVSIVWDKNNVQRDKLRKLKIPFIFLLNF